jgi:hypothetical protein
MPSAAYAGRRAGLVMSLAKGKPRAPNDAVIGKPLLGHARFGCPKFTLAMSVLASMSSSHVASQQFHA